MDFLSIFQEVWAVRALIASSLVGIMCGALGAFIVLRNMSLIGDALSHAILPGVVAAFVVVGYSSFGFFTGAVIAGVISAVGITWIQQTVRTKNDAAIGIVFTAMFSLGVIGISAISKNEGVHLDLKDFLFGNVLTVSDEDLMLTASVTVFVLLSIVVFYRQLFITTFQEVIAQTMGISTRFVHYFLMLLLSFAVVASLQTVGVILVVAMLITPASTALLLSDKLRNVIVISALLGWMAALSGFALSLVFETTPGPAMAVAATIIYLLAAFFAPSKGVLAKRLAAHNQQLKVEAEDLIKLGYKLEKLGDLTPHRLSAATGISGRRFRKHLRRLAHDGLLSWTNEMINLTREGEKQANMLIRAHRLWETYLVDQVGLTSEQIHEEAEIYEHHLTEDMLDEVDRELGYPEKDPHGSPIPPKAESTISTLSQMEVGHEGVISPNQPNALIASRLWKMGVLPNAEFRVLDKNESVVRFGVAGQVFILTPEDASLVSVDPPVHSSS